MKKNLHITIISIILGLGLQAQNTIEIDCEELFLSGANLAWVDFASDIGKFNVNDPTIIYPPNLNTFNTYFSGIKAAGGNSVRWWLHTDASYTPEIEYSGNVTGLSAALTNQEVIDQIIDVLDVAWDNELYVNISLFSFDILSSDTDRPNTSINLAGNKSFLESPTNIQSYIDNVLTPMVMALKDHPALVSWEIFNEPEGMSEEFGWTQNQAGLATSMANIQMVVNKLAGAIHDVDPDALVTNGAWSMLVNTDIDLNYSYAEEFQKNYYSDAELIAAGGAVNGILDFYQVHYYDWQHVNISPFHHPASYWQLDKPIMLGEFHAAEVQTIATDNGYLVDGAYEFLYDQGYFGAWGWQWKTSWLRADIEPQITHMQTAHPTIVDININGCPANTLDDDNDGVTNDLDICPNTPSGETVNSDGCSTNDLGDNDNDGIINGTDICPNTPNGESVDVNGCSTGELNDDDTDGVINGIDLCSSTPNGENVNIGGCSGSQLDDDQDGVTNDLDHCENTPLGETVNVNGCTDNQIDDDQDGVINSIDICSNTPSGYSVDSDGCAIVVIPDVSFEQALIDLGIDSDNAVNQQIKYMDVRFISSLNLQNKNISDLKGIEAFESLVTLNCDYNQITSIDISNNLDLTTLSIYDNQVTNIDVSNNVLLTYLDLGINQITSLDASNNNALTIFSIHSNPQLNSLNIRNGNNVSITTFLASSNPNLNCIQVDDATWSAANWTTIDAQTSFNEDCGYGLSVDDEVLQKAITFYPNPVFDNLTIESKILLTKIEIYSVLGKKVKEVNSEFNQISVADLSSGVYLVRVFSKDASIVKKLIKQ